MKLVVDNVANNKSKTYTVKAERGDLELTTEPNEVGLFISEVMLEHPHYTYSIAIGGMLVHGLEAPAPRLLMDSVESTQEIEATIGSESEELESLSRRLHEEAREDFAKRYPEFFE